MIYVAMEGRRDVVRVPKQEMDLDSDNYEFFIDEAKDRVVWVHTSRSCEFYPPHLIIGDRDDVRARWEC
jgi:hypothetical protein